ncbi:MAG: hypothetical protein JJT89_15575 [Nitriliruptoraceae bacterium]|nr:hypothetical protein [Nitriliruptoraceae bacterium]
MRRITTILCSLALVLAACGSADDTPTIEPEPGASGGDEGADEDAPEDDGTEDDVTEPPADETDPEPEPLPGDDDGAGQSDALLGAEVRQLTPEVAADAGVAESEVMVVTTELVTWSDGAIGCPEPGMMYTQALVEGYRIVFEAGGDTYTYHGAQGQEPFRCDDPQDPVARS